MALSWAGCGGRYTTEEGSGGGLIGTGGNSPGSGGKSPGSAGKFSSGGSSVGVGGAFPGTGGSFPGGTFGKGGSFPGTGGTVGGCGKGFGYCFGVCVNLLNDPYNCGGCGVYCESGVCNGASCAPLCGGFGFASCDGVCRDILNDPANCGGCYNSCLPGGYCAGGACQLTCEDGLSQCGMNCVNIENDPYNCGGCGIQCEFDAGVEQICDFGQCRAVGSTFTFSGIRKNLAQSSLAGWTQCHAEVYGGNGTNLGVIQQKCYKSRLLLGCRSTGTNLLLLAANAPRADVLFQNQNSVVHNANGVGWYYSTSRSWGFAPASAAVTLSTCDIESGSGDRRLCWHTTNNTLQGGWRCGLNTGLNADSSFERVIFHAD